MARQPVSKNGDFVPLPNNGFLDVQYCYSLPNNDKLDFDTNYCIVTTLSSDDNMNKVFKSVGFYEIIDNNLLNSLKGDFAFISLIFDRSKSTDIVERIKDFHSI